MTRYNDRKKKQLAHNGPVTCGAPGGLGPCQAPAPTVPCLSGVALT